MARQITKYESFSVPLPSSEGGQNVYTNKTYEIKADHHYVVYDGYGILLSFKQFGLTEIVILDYMARRARFNENTVEINAKVRANIFDKFGYSDTSINRALKNLEAISAIKRETRGQYVISPQVTFRGTATAREHLKTTYFEKTTKKYVMKDVPRKKPEKKVVTKSIKTKA